MLCALLTVHDAAGVHVLPVWLQLGRYSSETVNKYGVE